MPADCEMMKPMPAAVSILMIAGQLAIASDGELPHRWVGMPIEVADARLYSRAIDDSGRVTGQWRQWDGQQWHRAPFIWSNGNLEVVDSPYAYAEGLLMEKVGFVWGFEYEEDLLIRIDDTGLHAMAQLKEVTSTGGLIGVSSDGSVVGGNIYAGGFVWTEQDGVTYLSEGEWDKATIAGVGTGGDVVGTIDLNHVWDERAFLYQPDVGEVVELLPEFDGATRATGLSADRIMLIKTRSDGQVEFELHGDPYGLGNIQVLTVEGAPLNAHALSNYGSGVAMTWNQPGEPPELAWWQFGMDEPHLFDVPDDIIGLKLISLPGVDGILGAYLNADYQFRPFLAQWTTGIRDMSHAIIGYPLDLFGGPVTSNISGDILWAPSSSTYTPMLVLSGARPGDATGDGVVDTNDLLGVIAAWGWFDESDPCGPDLNLDGSVGTDDLLEVLGEWMAG